MTQGATDGRTHDAADGTDAAAAGAAAAADAKDAAADGRDQDAALDAVAVLADPVRRALYRYVAAAGRDVGRAEAAEAVGVQRTLAAHHLDKLAEVGLVEVAFARPAGRGGPGAGRPAKLYRPAAGELSVSVPTRAYDAAGLVLAEALERLRADEAVARAGREEGYAAGLPYRPPGGAPPGTVAEQGVRLREALRARGYEPRQDEAGMRLRNCPFHRLAEQFPPLVCGMNLALLEGLVDGAATPGWRPTIAPGGDGCCVVLEPVPSAAPD